MWINRTRPCSVARTKVRFCLAWAIAIYPLIDLVKLPCLFCAQIEEFAECLLDVRVGVMGKNHTPAGLIELGAVHSLNNTQVLFRAQTLLVAQLSNILWWASAKDELRELIGWHGRNIIRAIRTVQTVEVQEII